MTPNKPKDLRQIMLHTDLIEQALRKAGTEALIRHKRLGNPIVVWRDGKVVWIPAEEIEIPDLKQPLRRESEADSSRETVED